MEIIANHHVNRNDNTLLDEEKEGGMVDGGDRLRSKTSERIQYEAQVEVIRGQIGGLEGVRRRLGLSQRKISQLLLVDPSAWTRWIRNGEKAPPHIWRALQWYLALKEQIPGLTPQYFLGGDSARFQTDISGRLERGFKAQNHIIEQSEFKLQQIREELSYIKRENSKLKWAVIFLSLGFLVILVSLLVTLSN